MRVYRRSLSFLLVAAAHELFPESQIIIDYGLNFGAIYCEVENRPDFTKKELKRIEARMRQMVALLKEYPIDFDALLTGLLYWNDDRKRKQNAWARDFYRNIQDDTETEHTSQKEQAV